MSGKHRSVHILPTMDDNLDNTDNDYESNEAMEQDESYDEPVIVQRSNLINKNYGKKTSISYKKLIVPQSMRSIYWKYFGFPADEHGTVITKDKIVCMKCRTPIAYNRNTSNLRMHLQNKHMQLLHDLELATPPRKQNITPESKEKRTQKRLLKAAMANSTHHLFETSMEGTIDYRDNVLNQYVQPINFTEEIRVHGTKPLKIIMNSNASNNNVEIDEYQISEINSSRTNLSNNVAMNSVLEFIIIDLQLPDIVQEPGFQRFVATFNSPCALPTKNSLEETHIPSKYNSFKETILSIINSITGEISLAAEEWVSNCGESFITFLIYFQNMEESILESKMLCTVHAPKHWNVTHWENTIESVFKNWQISIEKVTAVVVSSDRKEFINALKNKGLIVIPCLLHSLQVCAQTCFKKNDIAKLLNKCRSIVGTILANPEAASILFEQEQISENSLEHNTMVLDCSSHWITTFNMLQQMTFRKDIINNIFSEIDDIDQNNVNLTDDEWKHVDELVESLSHFNITMETLSEEKIPHVSLLKPLLWQLVTAHLQVQDEDTKSAAIIKKSLSDTLTKRYSDDNLLTMLKIATALDPRFKEVQYTTEEEKKDVFASITDILNKLIKDDKEEVKIKVEVDSPSPKKTRLSGMERLLGGLRPSKKIMTPDEKANLEIAQYQSESPIFISNCPLEWWSKVSLKCPNLGKIASRYNCVPVCCLPSSRISPTNQLIYNTKRATIPPHLIDKLLFLNANYNLVQV